MVPPEKPHAPATERNRDAILAMLREHLHGSLSVLEIGSGTGQHAVHFAGALPDLRWQCSDRGERLDGIALWLDEAGLPNTPPAIELDVAADWPETGFDAVFSANTLHIMAWPLVERLFAQLPQVLNGNGKLIIYGPFNYNGLHTSPSNAAFDASLRGSDPNQGIRDFERVDGLAQAAGLQLLEDRGMPANNRCLIWQRR